MEENGNGNNGNGVLVKASDLFVECLEQEGVEVVFGVPGEETLDFLESLRKSKIKFILARDEQAAAFMAATYGRLTGKAGVVLATLGPGAINLINGVAFANLAGIPLVALTAQNGIRDNIKENDFQFVDVIEVFRPVTKWNKSISAGKWIPKSVRTAFKIAEAERPGATHLELPEDVMAEEVSGASVLHKNSVRRPAPDSLAIEQAVEMLKNAKRPIIIAASGGVRKRVDKQLAELVAKTGLYVVHTQMGKGLLSDSDSHSLFAIGIHKSDYAHCGLHSADVVMTIGYHIGEYIPRVWNPLKDKKIIHVDFTESGVDNYYNPDVELVGDIADSLSVLTKRLGKEKWDLAYFKRVRSFLEKELSKNNLDSSFPLKPQRILHDLRQALGKSDIVIHDNGMHKIWAARHFPVYEPNTFLVDNALASMGGGLPSAIAAKILYPQKKVVAVVGDGGFMMNSQELETAVRLGLNVVVLLWNDNGFGMVRWHQEKSKGHFKVFGVNYNNPDFVKYAESYGAVGMRVNKASELAKALETAFKQKKPVVIEVPVDYSENAKLSEELERLVCPM